MERRPKCMPYGQRRSRVEHDLDGLRAPDAVSYNGGGPRWNKGETCPESERLTILQRSERVWRNCALGAIGPSRARRLIPVPAQIGRRPARTKAKINAGFPVRLFSERSSVKGSDPHDWPEGSLIKLEQIIGRRQHDLK